MSPTKNALIQRLKKFRALSTSEINAVHALEVDMNTRLRRSSVFDVARPDDRIAIVQQGWAVSKITTTTNFTTIAQIFMCGDIIGLNDIGLSHTPHNVVMQTPGIVSLTTKKKLFALGRRHPQLLELILAVSSLDSVVMRDRLHTITRLSAEERLMHLLLEIKSKTDQVTESASDQFPMYLSQKEIGDVLGLTDIYVNRLLRNMVKSAQITLARPYVKLLERESWTKRLDYHDRYRDEQVDWAA